jgi:hypothetical protein
MNPPMENIFLIIYMTTRRYVPLNQGVTHATSRKPQNGGVAQMVQELYVTRVASVSRGTCIAVE